MSDKYEVAGFTITETHYPVLDWEGRTSDEGPKVSARSWVTATWDTLNGVPTLGQIHEAAVEMRLRYPGRGEDYRIMGLPKPGDLVFGVEIA